MRTASFRAAVLAASVALGCGGSTAATNGACDGGASCDGGATPPPEDSGVDGVTTILSGTAARPTQLLSDGTTLYWVDGVTKALTSMPVEGGPTRTLAAPAELLLVDDANAYFLGTGAVQSVPKSGGPPSPLGPPAGAVMTAAAYGEVAFWIEGGGATPSESIVSFALPGGPRQTVADLGTLSPVLRIAATDQSVFVLSHGLTRFARTGAADAGPAPVVPVGTCSVLASGAAAVICGQSSGPLLRVGDDGRIDTLDPDAGNVTSVAVDGDAVYWVDEAEAGHVARVATGGGSTTVLANATRPVSVAVDARFVYWATDAGTIVRRPK